MLTSYVLTNLRTLTKPMKTNQMQNCQLVVMTQADTHSEIDNPQRGLTLQLKQGEVY